MRALAGAIAAAAVAVMAFLAPAAADERLPLSALRPAGPAAADIATVWWVMAIGATLITALMTVLGLYAVRSRPRPIDEAAGRRLVLYGGVAFPGVVLFALLVYGARSGEAMLPGAGDDAFEVSVTAHRFWWETAYPGFGAGEANVLHVPAGRPVHVSVTASDVIHSFWVPRLAGKIDAIPGRINRIRLFAEAPGVYRGICAEFCGTGHTGMEFEVRALPEDELGAILAGFAAAPAPSAPEATP